MKPHYFNQISKLLMRPSHIYTTVRGRFFFALTHYLMLIPFLKNKNITLANNVRVQGVTVLMAEQPDAKIYLGENTIVYEDAKIEAYGQGQIRIGANSVIGRTQIFSRLQITIGSHVVTSWNVFLQDYDPHPIDADLRQKQIELITRQFLPAFEDASNAEQPPLADWRAELARWTPPMESITIGNNVWIGANTSILKGAHIGDHCIVAAHAVVLAGNYPAHSLLAGVPAKVIKSI